jgi:hypothetical protein
MTREKLLELINQKIDEEGGAFSMRKVDVAVFCYNLGVKDSMQEYQSHSEEPNPVDEKCDLSTLLIAQLRASK